MTYAAHEPHASMLKSNFLHERTKREKFEVKTLSLQKKKAPKSCVMPLLLPSLPPSKKKAPKAVFMQNIFDAIVIDMPSAPTCLGLSLLDCTTSLVNQQISKNSFPLQNLTLTHLAYEPSPYKL